MGENDSDTSVDRPSEVQMQKAQKIFKHPKWDEKSEHDIALVYLEKEVQWSQYVKPVCLVNDLKETFKGQMATVAGWRRTLSDEEKSSILRKVELPILSNSDCEQWYQEENVDYPIIKGALCAGYEQGGKDTCQGDSGGPLMVKHSTGRYVLAGITSWGVGCAKLKLPGVNTRTQSYLDWIIGTITKQYYAEHNQMIYRRMQ